MRFYATQPCGCPHGVHVKDCPDGFEPGTYDSTDGDTSVGEDIYLHCDTHERTPGRGSRRRKIYTRRHV